MEFVQKLNKYIREISNLPAFHGDTDLRDSTVSYFTVIRNYYDDQIKEIVRIKSLFFPMDDDTNKVPELLREVQEASGIVLRHFTDAQYRFADKFGFPLKEPGK